MNQKLWSSLTAALLVAAFGPNSSSYAAKYTGVDDFNPKSQASGTAVQSSPIPMSGVKSTQLINRAQKQLSEMAQVVKVGEPQSQTGGRQAIAKVQVHKIDNQKASILYLRGIPVLTFLGSGLENPGVKAAAVGSTRQPEAAPTDPLAKATVVAAKLNQHYFNNQLSADRVTVNWVGSATADRYVIRLNDEDLVVLDRNVRSPDATQNLEKDALQVTNRLRRLLGNAEPLQAVAGKPKTQPVQAVVARVQQALQGWASWYGPGFHGNRSASGEVFNQNELTAAHRNLPFGTRVRVTNLDNGRSVVVKINDRGPYVYNRIIDLSRGAAQVLGLISSGVAPVKVEVLGR